MPKSTSHIVGWCSFASRALALFALQPPLCHRTQPVVPFALTRISRLARTLSPVSAMGTSLKSAGRSSRQAPAQFKRQAHKHPQRARCALRAHGNSVTHENAEASDREGYIASTPPRRRFKLSQIIDASQHYPARMAPLIGRRMHREARCALRAHQNQQPCQDAFAGERDGYISEIYGQIVTPSANAI